MQPFSPLTELGLENSDKLKDILKMLNIDQIYSSPFIELYKQYSHILI